MTVSRRRATALPTDILFGLALLCSVIQFAPGISRLNELSPVPIQGPITLTWLLLVFLSRPAVRKGVGLGLAISAAGLVSLGASSPDVLYATVGGLLVPVALFVGLQLVSDEEVLRARTSFRWVLTAVSALQVYYFFRIVGWDSALSISFVIGHHTDVALWAEVGGKVLANPTNASVIYCTAFAWAVMERALGTPSRFSWAVVSVTGLAVFVTGSRGAYLTVALVLVGAALFHVQSRRRGGLVVAVAAVVVVAGRYWLDTFASTARTGDSLAARLEARQATIPVVLGSPFGSGPGTTADTLRPYLRQVTFLGSDIRGATSHDPFLNWGVSVGLIGLALLVIAIVIALGRAISQSPLLAMPLLAFLFSAESTGLDILNATNFSWSAVLFVLLGLAWRADSFSKTLHLAAKPTNGDRDPGVRVHDGLPVQGGIV